MRPEDLRGEAGDAYRMWHDFFGLSEAAALTRFRRMVWSNQVNLTVLYRLFAAFSG